MKIDHVISLARYALSGNMDMIAQVLRSMIANERSAGKEGNAKALERVLGGSHTIMNGRSSSEVAALATKAKGLYEEGVSGIKVYDLLFPTRIYDETFFIIDQNKDVQKLLNAGVQPSNRMMLTGPPGNGKTALANAIANELERPMLTVRYETLIGSYLGSTGSNIANLFEYASSINCVLFIDEIDMISKERSDPHETGEIKRVVGILLLKLDALPPTTMVIGSSNHPDLIDRATWRRFTSRMYVPAPTRDDISRYINLQFNSNVSERFIKSARYVPVNYSEAKDMCNYAKAYLMLREVEGSEEDRCIAALNVWSDMRSVYEGAKDEFKIPSVTS